MGTLFEVHWKPKGKAPPTVTTSWGEPPASIVLDLGWLAIVGGALVVP